MITVQEYLKLEDRFKVIIHAATQHEYEEFKCACLEPNATFDIVANLINNLYYTRIYRAITKKLDTLDLHHLSIWMIYQFKHELKYNKDFQEDLFDIIDLHKTERKLKNFK